MFAWLEDGSSFDFFHDSRAETGSMLVFPVCGLELFFAYHILVDFTDVIHVSPAGGESETFVFC